MKKKLPDPEMIDDDNPEWTQEDFRNSLSLKEGFPEIYANWKRSRGRPKSANPKVNATIRLDGSLLKRLRASGRGWQARVGLILQQAVADGRI